MNFSFTKHRFFRLASCLAILLLILAVFLHSPHRERDLRFHPVWTEADRQQITEIIEYWENQSLERELRLGTSLRNFADDVTDSPKNTWNIIKSKWNNLKSRKQLLSIYSYMLDAAYTTAETGNASYIAKHNWTLFRLSLYGQKGDLALHLAQTGTNLDVLPSLSPMESFWSPSENTLSQIINCNLEAHQRWALLLIALEKNPYLVKSYKKSDSVFYDVCKSYCFLKCNVTSEIFDKLIELGADVNKASYSGETALMILCDEVITFRRCDEIGELKPLLDNARQAIRLLLDRGADPTLKNNEGKTVLDSFKRTSPEVQAIIREDLPELFEISSSVQ